MKYLITGGTGSFGKHYVKWLTEHNQEVVVFSRNEFAQWEMKKDFPDVEFIIGDIREKYSIYEAVEGCDFIIHAAALKHVATGECQPWEPILTNVIGTQNVINAVKKNANIGAKMVLLSTDKAVRPVNLYGASKLAAEKLTIAAGYTVTRYGNIFGSRGSVLHIFKQQAAEGHLFTITDRRMTRFVMTFDEAIELVNFALSHDSGYFLPERHRGINITDLAFAFDEQAQFTEMGIQSGEKLHEWLSDTPVISSENCEKLSVEEIRGMIDECV